MSHFTLPPGFMNFAKQAEEIFLIQSSLLPAEILHFVDDSVSWQNALNSLTLGGTVDTLAGTLSLAAPADFIVKIEEFDPYFRVVLLPEYPSKPDAFTVNIQGNIQKTEQERWMDIIRERRCEINDTDFPIFELLSSYLLPLLHEELASKADTIPDSNHDQRVSSYSHENHPHFHALLTSHHLISSQKRKSLKQWSEEHSLSGFAKIGYPGIIYCTGAQSDVQEFVSKVKNMQWLALRARFIGSLPNEHEKVNPSTNRPSWKEVEKIGEVIEEMKRYGQEEYAYEFGIGSGGSKG